MADYTKIFEGGGEALTGGLGMYGSYRSNEEKLRAAKEYAEAQRKAEEQARSEFGDAYTDISSFYNPYMEGGTEAFGQYQDLDTSFMPGEFEYSKTIGDFLDPSMDFQIEQAMRPIESSAAAGGSLGSGATLKALQDRGQQVASLNYGQAYDRMANDKSFAYKNYLNRANMQRQQNQDRGNQLQNLFNTGYNATQNVAGARDNLGTRTADSYRQASNIPTDTALRAQTNAANWQTFTDPEATGQIFGGTQKAASGFF